MYTNYPKPQKSDIIASSGEIKFRRFLGAITSVLALYVMLPVILLTYKEFLAALFTWIIILAVIYFVVNPILKFFKSHIVDKLFNTEERYRKQIIERLLSYYSKKTNLSLDESKKYVDYLEKAYPTAEALENWLSNKNSE